MKTEVKKSQVTRWQQENTKLPSPSEDYFWFKEVNTGISKGICMYGYEESIEIGPGHYKTRWVPIKEAEELLATKDK